MTLPVPRDVPYRKLLELSRQMLAAGNAQEWDRLLDLEKQRQCLFAALSADPAGDGDVRAEELADVLREIQRTDRALIEKVGTWLEHAKILLRIPPGPGGDA